MNTREGFSSCEGMFKMKLRSTVFDSQSEASVFRSLQSRWSHLLRLYPSLPLSKIIRAEKEELAPQEWEFYLKTNVDYTFCEAKGRPLLSIEFDGIGGGFSKDGVYVPSRDSGDAYRKLKLDFKLRAAKCVDYPLIVVSYEEIKHLEEDDSLTILDGIIGQFLAREEFQKRIKEMAEESQAEIEELSEYAKHEYIQDLVLSAEVQAELEADPIARQASEHNLACLQYGVIRWGGEFLTDPPLPDLKDFFDVEGLQARIDAWENAVRVGYRLRIDIPKVSIVQPVWLRNFRSLGILPESIAKNIAEYLGFKRAHKLLAGCRGL